MTAAPAAMLAPAGARAELEAYRAPHRIDPEYPHSGRFVYDGCCLVCGLPILPIRGGWRHDPGEIRRLEAAARRAA